MKPTKKNYATQLDSWRKTIQSLTEKRKLFVKQYKQESVEISRLEKEVADVQHVQSLVQTVAAEVQQSVHAQIAAVVSKCLTTVFGESAYEFDIAFAKRRGKTEAVLSFVRNGEHINPLDAAGGGVVDVASFALRLACVVCSQPKLRKLIVVDEPFRHLQKSLHPIAGQLMLELAKEMDVQFVIVTHNEDMEVGKVIRLK